MAPSALAASASNASADARAVLRTCAWYAAVRSSGSFFGALFLCSSDAPFSSGRFMMSRIALSCHRQMPNAIRNTTMQAISRLRSSSR